MLTYRSFRAQDSDDVVLLMAELGYELTAITLASRVIDIRKNGGEVIIAEQNKKIVGCINMIIDIRLAEGTTGEIVSLAVTKPCRGKGIGKCLIKAAEQWLQPRCDFIRIRANSVRHEAHQFYQSLDFEPIKTQQIFIKKISQNR